MSDHPHAPHRQQEASESTQKLESTIARAVPNPWDRFLTGVRSFIKGGEPVGSVHASSVVEHTQQPVDGNLQVQNVSKRFGDTQVLRDISLTVESGQFVTLLGPSGCGKTTLLRVIAGLELADAGCVLLGDMDLGPLPANRRPVNTVFQSYALFPHMTVYENVAFGLRSRSINDAHARPRIERALEMLRIETFATRQPHQLSGGQRQRVALARALVNEPSVLLLDEPMSALDAKLRAEVQIELRRLQQKLGKTFILVTHDQDEAMSVSDRILVMRDGRIEQSGTPAEVYERPRNRFVAEFLGSANLINGHCRNGTIQTDLGDLSARERPTWEQGTLAIRPERIRVLSTKPKANAVRAKVKEVIYRGSHQEVFVEPGALRVQASAARRVLPGEMVWLELPQESVEVLVD